MDVLKEIQQAEQQAETIERENQARASEILASVPAELARLREEMEKELDSEAARLASDRDSSMAKEKKNILADAAVEREALKKKASAATPGAVQLLMKRLGL